VSRTFVVYSIDSNTTVLIVDHDATNLRLARRVLESAGFEVCDATDAVSTFEVLKTCRPDIIVLDIQLPGMDGWELTRRLCANFATREIPIIAVTAFGSASDEEYARLAGCVDFIRGPLSSTELPGVIRRHLTAHK
jgi:two-component system cell cycle response regulator DivK